MSGLLFTCLLAVLASPVLSQSCTGGRVHSSCGSPCPLTCDNRDNPPLCLTVCATGCFCPQGTVLHNDQCINPSECPDAVTTVPPPPPPTTTIVELETLPELDVTCPNGKIHQQCGTACPRTCDNYQDEFIPCTRQCVEGCFCSYGLVELGERCVLPEDCPNAVTTVPPPPPPTTTIVELETLPELDVTCPNGKIHYQCGTACPRTCDNYQDEVIPCTLQCVEGCFCSYGLVELGERCVLPEDCPNAVTTVPPPPPPTTTIVELETLPELDVTCPNGKIHQQCGTACPRTCDNYQDEFIPCTRQCVEGCFCSYGLVELGERCVLPEDCPNAVTTVPPPPPPTTTIVELETLPELDVTCPNGKIHQQCGTACPRTCDNYQDEFIPCTRQCVEGCFCSYGLVELGERCVLPEDCPNAVTTVPPPPPPTTTIVELETLPELDVTCPNGKIHQQCGTACPRTCDNYQDEVIPCTLQCVEGCFCSYGLVELGERCVLPEDCPTAVITTSEPSQPTCANGKIYEQCGTACPLTCANYNGPPVPCPDVCVQGCFCPRGLVQLGETCVAPGSCPDSCPAGMVYNQCGTACPLTCDNRDNPPACTRQCVAGCFCPEGTLQDSSGRCVQESECPGRECPYGMEYRECGPLCPYTCDSHFGTNPCFSLRCAPGGCYCPDRHVMADGRCTPAELACEDGKPTIPAVNIKPTVHLQVKIRNTHIDDFMNHRDRLLGDVGDVLSRRGYGQVDVGVHSVSQEEHLVVVIQLSSDGISAAQAEELANLLSEESGTFTLEIVEVTVVSDESGSDSDVLSKPAIIGIAVGSSVFILVLIILLSAILVMCMKNKSMNHKQDTYREKSALAVQNSSESPPDSNYYTKGKLVRESLLY